MGCTKETKQKMDGILEAFSGYLEKQSRFEIRYTEETGYTRCAANKPEEPPVRIDTPDKLVETLIGGIADDVLAQKLSAPLPEDGVVKLEIKAEIYRQIMEPVKKIAEDRAHYVDLAINYYQDRFERK